ncbi:MAG TPA: M23 family peptidase [Micrococcaceae bacterium]|nr:M23 family peptidase [Micrococcaceae bacterium]
MAETRTTGRRRAADVEIDAIAEIATAAIERPVGRRASREATVEALEIIAPVCADYVGRRFASGQRYGIAPTSKILAAQDVDGNVIALPTAKPVMASEGAVASNGELVQSLHGSPKKASRLGFTHKIAAVAAVSGLALAAVSPQLTGTEPDEPASVASAQRTATSAVVDVKAPENAGLEVQRAALKSDINPNVAEENKLSEILTASGGNIQKIGSTGGLLQRPVDSNRITSPFGHRKNPTGAGFMIHSGTDYGVPSGTKVYAAASGTVEVAGWAGHSGQRVTVGHGNGLETGYSHNSKILVKVGDKVQRGDVIALAGSTGNSTGPHVHFEVIVDGQFKDPAGWL